VTVEIRPANPEDLATCLELLNLLCSVEPDFPWEPDRQKAGLKALLASGDSVILVADEEGQVQGMVTAQLVVSTAEGGLSALVEDLVVAPGSRGSGLGRRLLSEAASWAARNKATRLQLLADEENTQALDFYRDLGWRRTRMICLRRGLAGGAEHM
jgi:ribosomal protein S18 acetylase RimI-like enzyme